MVSQNHFSKYFIQPDDIDEFNKYLVDHGNFSIFI